MEFWDLYNENREIVGTNHIRGNELPDNCYHLVVHIWIKNSKGQYLISQRSANRPTHPLMWECVGGSVIKGENSLQGAIRETKEEVGLDLANLKGEIVYTKIRSIVNNQKVNDIMDVWLFRYDGKVELSNATTDEVAQVKWMYKEEIQKLFEDGKMCNSLRYFLNEIDI